MEVIKMLPRYMVKKRTNQKRTHEEYVKEVKLKNPSVTVVGTYVDARTKIMHKCNLCNNEWETSPDSVLHGHGCKSCSLKETFKIHPKTQPKLRKYHEQYVKDLYEANPNIEILDEYITTEHKNHFRCRVCGYEWYGKAGSYLSGKGCYMCAQKKKTERKMTHAEFIERLAKINEFVEVLEEYVNSYTKIACRCKIDNYDFYASPNSLLAGHGCPECWKRNITLTEEEFLKKVENNLHNVILLSTYTKCSDYCLCKCKICGNQWQTQFSNIITGNFGCRKCSDRNRRLTNEEFLEKFNKVTDSILPLDEYSNANTKMKFKCLICNNIWETKPHNILSGQGCPVCKESHGERRIRQFLTKEGIKFIPQKTFDGLTGVGNGLLSYDFYLLKYNLLIEFQGGQHEFPVKFFGEEQFKKQQEHDRRKREYAEQNNINLLEIWYYDIDNIESILLQKINEIKENNLKLESVETVTVA